MQIGANASWTGRNRPIWEQGAEIRTVSSAHTADEIQVLGVLADASQPHSRLSTAPSFSTEQRPLGSGWISRRPATKQAADRERRPDR
jgi:hypothetical protein